MSETLAEQLEALEAKATPGPYRLHDHTTYPFDKPDDWIGYAWVGRITNNSEPDGRFDAGWFETDRRKDGDRDYRARASDDANLIVTVLNNLPAIIAALKESQELRETVARLRRHIGRLEERAVLHDAERTLILHDAEINNIVQSRLSREKWTIGSEGYVRSTALENPDG